MNRSPSVRRVAFAVGMCLLLVASGLVEQQLRSGAAPGNAGLRVETVTVAGSYATDFGNGASGGTLPISASSGDAVWVFVSENAASNNVASVTDSNGNSMTEASWLAGNGGTTTPAIFLYVIDSETASTSSVTVTNTGNTATSVAALVLTGVSTSSSVAAYGSGQWNGSAASITSTGDSATSPSASDPYFLFYGVSANGGTATWSGVNGASTVVSTAGSGSNQAVGVFEQNFSSSGSNTILADGSTGQGTSNWYGLAVVAAVAGSGSGHVPGAPTGLRATGNSTTEISLAWTLPNGALSNVTLYYAQSGCPMSGTIHGLSLGNVSVYTVRGLGWGTGYAFQVQAWNSSGGSSLSLCATTATASLATYGYLERIYRLPGFDPLTGYLSNLGGADSQIPTLSSNPRQPAGIYYVDNSSNLDIVYLGNGTQHVIAHVVSLYQTYATYNEMLDNEFFVEFGYDQALFFGTTTSSGTTYSIELVNLTTGQTQVWNTPAAVDSYNQQPQYVGNNTVIVMSSNCSILAWNLASRQEWSAGTLGASFGSGSTCFEANNAYWFPQKQEIINVEAHGGSGDHVEQLNASFDSQGRIHFASVATIAVDSSVVFNWVNGIAYNASSDEIAFSAGYWVANTVYTYVVPYANGRITATGLVRYSADNSGTPTGQLLAIQRYVYVDDYMLGQHMGPGTWANGTQFLFDPWNGSLEVANRSLDDAPCGNECFEGNYAPSPAYQLDYNATLLLNDPMYRVVYAYHSAISPSPSVTLSLTPSSGPVGTTVTLSGSGYGATVGYTYCFQSAAAACSTGPTFPSTSGGGIPSGVTLSVPSSANAYVDVSNGTHLIVDAPFSVTTASVSAFPAAGPLGTLVTVSGSGFAPGVAYVYCLSASTAACSSGPTFTSTGAGAVPSGMTLRVTSSSTAYLVASNGTLVVADVPFIVTSAALTLVPSTGPSGTIVNLTGSGFAADTSYDLCWAPSSAAVGCPTTLNFTSAASGSIPLGVNLTWRSGDAWVAISQGLSALDFVISARFTPQTRGGGGGTNSTALSPPTDLAAAPGSSCASEMLTWTNPPAANGLVVISDSIYISTGSGLLLDEVDLEAPAQTHTLTGLVCSLTYEAQVRAWYTGDTGSPMSDNVSFTTAPVPGQTTVVSQPTLSHSFLLLMILGLLVLVAVIVVAAVAISHQGRRPSGGRR
jgi:hypothetical protein